MEVLKPVKDRLFKFSVCFIQCGSQKCHSSPSPNLDTILPILPKLEISSNPLCRSEITQPPPQLEPISTQENDMNDVCLPDYIISSKKDQKYYYPKRFQIKKDAIGRPSGVVVVAGRLGGMPRLIIRPTHTCLTSFSL
jgi:hypothetical protein